MSFENLPQIVSTFEDGNLAVLPVNTNPKVLVIGTAAQGTSESLYAVGRPADAVSLFGKSGNLIRGMYEVLNGGALNVSLMRIGATTAKLSGIGNTVGVGGFTVETIERDDSAGVDYSIYYEKASTRLQVYRVSDGTVVYDNYPTYYLANIDLGEVAVSGTAGSGASIGTASVPVTLAAANNVYTGVTYTAGTDGLTLSRMALYEALFNAYQDLSDQDLDFIVPMNTYLDDLNVMDMSAATISTKGLTALSTYPTAGASNDALGLMYTEEYQGKNYFWWFFPSDPTNQTFTSAQIYPAGVGSASATKKSNGTALALADFHEVNFAYRLATFCYTQSEDNTEMVGMVGVLPPVSSSPKDVSNWVGKLPVTATNSGGQTVVVTNGTGLLGNKFVSGRITSGGIVGFTTQGIQGNYNGGFIATDSNFIDGNELQDDNLHYIDIGKYLSLVATWPILSNPSQANAYSGTGAAHYAGFASTLPASSAPTNKQLSGLRLPYRINKTKLDLLAGQRFVTFHESSKRGIVVSDAPTAARPDSDYRRFSTVMIVKSAINAVRDVAEPFLGNSVGGVKLAALDTAIDKTLSGKVKAGELTRYDHQLTSTPQMRVLGQALCQLTLVPAFELRQLTVVVSLAAS